ncbi:MAG: hypothetical protein BRD42_09520 [Bacteroidetes bacterium QS_3_64_15]|nr:MAG: hypothetical protein BRD42_09520 [Bacteroidetes bacterium QS_3_64_15]
MSETRHRPTARSGRCRGPAGDKVGQRRVDFTYSPAEGPPLPRRKGGISAQQRRIHDPGSLPALFIINPTVSFVALAVTLGVYVLLARRELAPLEDVRSGMSCTGGGSWRRLCA